MGKGMPRLNHISELSKLSDSEGQVDLAVGVYPAAIFSRSSAVVTLFTKRIRELVEVRINPKAYGEWSV